jgi:hypothetical protein
MRRDRHQDDWLKRKGSGASAGKLGELPFSWKLKKIRLLRGLLSASRRHSLLASTCKGAQLAQMPWNSPTALEPVTIRPGPNLIT